MKNYSYKEIVRFLEEKGALNDEIKEELQTEMKKYKKFYILEDINFDYLDETFPKELQGKYGCVIYFADDKKTFFVPSDGISYMLILSHWYIAYPAYPEEPDFLIVPVEALSEFIKLPDEE